MRWKSTLETDEGWVSGVLKEDGMATLYSRV
jgi:hypothetical protein